MTNIFNVNMSIVLQLVVLLYCKHNLGVFRKIRLNQDKGRISVKVRSPSTL
jgi:hypothetical protein